jgi:hypothetical protein
MCYARSNLALLLVLFSPALAARPEQRAVDPDAPPVSWVAPPYWLPGGPPGNEEKVSLPFQTGLQPGAGATTALVAGPAAVPSGALPFFAIAPCRLLDTRGNGFSGLYGPPSLVAYTARTFPVPGQCGIPSSAEAVSVNATVVIPAAAGWIAFFPTGTAWGGVANVNFVGNDVVGNSAVIPLGTGGSFEAYPSSATDLVVDVNGYYAPLSAVTSLNTLTGAVTLAEGSNVTITPSGNTLTVAASSGPGGSLPAGSTGQTLRHDGANWTASNLLYNSGTAIGIGTTSPAQALDVNGMIRMPATAASGGMPTTGVVFLGSSPFLHNYAAPGSDGFNTFVGQQAGNFSMTWSSDTTQGSYNTASGTLSLSSNTTGSENAALGASSLMSNTTGRNNTAIGSGALANNTTIYGSTAVGRMALWNQRFDPGVQVWQSQNTAVGESALFMNNPTSTDPMNGFANTAIGFSALRSNTIGTRNAALGSNALRYNTIGEGNVALGHTAMRNNTTANFNTAIGAWALYVQSFDNGGGNYDSENTAIGYVALYSNQPTGAGNGTKNTAVGSQSMRYNTTGMGNTAVGHWSLGSNTTSNNNVAVGSNALQYQSFDNGGTPFDSVNTAVGVSALQFNQPTSTTTGTFNTALGAGALNQNTIGANNIAMGAISGFNLTTGNYNIDIGNQGVAGEGNTIRIGDSNQTRAFVAGIRGTTTGAGDAIPVVVDSNGQLGTVSSSIRFKTDVGDVDDAAKRLLELRPVTFRYKDQSDGRRHFGLIAEEVDEVLPELVVRDASGRPETVAYHELPALLLDELKKQQAVIRSQQAQIDELRALVHELATRRSENPEDVPSR